MSIVKNNSQINLKLPEKLIGLAEEYADFHGYSNVQELIRESLRDKVFSEEVREEYIAKLIKEEGKREWLGREKSELMLLELGKRALNFKGIHEK